MLIVELAPMAEPSAAMLPSESTPPSRIDTVELLPSRPTKAPPPASTVPAMDTEESPTTPR